MIFGSDPGAIHEDRYNRSLRRDREADHLGTWRGCSSLAGPTQGKEADGTGLNREWPNFFLRRAWQAHALSQRLSDNARKPLLAKQNQAWPTCCPAPAFRRLLTNIGSGGSQQVSLVTFPCRRKESHTWQLWNKRSLYLLEP
jgi:hypothetical protein